MSPCTHPFSFSSASSENLLYVRFSATCGIQRHKLRLLHHGLVFRLLLVLFSVLLGFSLAIADPFQNPVKVVDCFPRKNSHMYEHLHLILWGSQTLRSLLVDAREVRGLQVKKLRMRDVGELVILKVCCCSPARREAPLTLPLKFYQTSCDSAHPRYT